MLDVLESLTDDDLKREAKNEAKNKSFPSLFRVSSPAKKSTFHLNYFITKVFESCLSGRSGSKGDDSKSGGVENEDDIEVRRWIHKFKNTLIYSIRRLLQISSFNGKMNALNEVNKMVLASYGSSSYGRQ